MCVCVCVGVWVCVCVGVLALGRGVSLQALGRDGGGDSRADWRGRRSIVQLTEDEVSDLAFLFRGPGAETFEPAQAQGPGTCNWQCCRFRL